LKRQEDDDESERRPTVSNAQWCRNGARREVRRRVVGGPQQQREHDRPARDPEPGIGHRIVQHGKDDAEEGEQRWRRDGKQGRALCAQLRRGWPANLGQRHRGEHGD